MFKTLDPIAFATIKDIRQDFLTTPVTDDDKLYTHDTSWGRYKIYKKESRVNFLKQHLEHVVPGWKIMGGSIFSSFYPMAISADGSSKTLKINNIINQRNKDGKVEDARFNPTIGTYVKSKPADTHQTLYIPLLITGSNVKLYIMKQRNWNIDARTYEKKISTTDNVGNFSLDVVDYNDALVKDCNHVKKTCFYKLVKGANIDLSESIPIMFNSSYLNVTNNWSATCTSLTVLKVFMTKAEEYNMLISNSANAFSANAV